MSVVRLTSVEGMSDSAILYKLLDGPLRIPMHEMKLITNLRDRGMIECGQEMTDCIAVNCGGSPAKGYIITGKPALNCWVFLTFKGRVYARGGADEGEALTPITEC